MPQVLSQADGRAWREYEDVHGRRWGCVMDTRCKTGPGPVGPIEYIEYRRAGQPGCVSPFKPPWLPEQMYMRPSATRMDLMEIDYDRMLSDALKAHRAYHNACAEVAGELNEQYTPGGEVPVKVRRVVGKAPRPLEPIKAAMQGNRWVLGMTDTPHAALAAILKPAKAEDADWLEGMDFADEGAESEDEMDTRTPIEKARDAKAQKRSMAGV